MRMSLPECVRWKREGAARIYEETKDLSLAEFVAYWQALGKELRQPVDQLKSERQRAEPR